MAYTAIPTRSTAYLVTANDYNDSANNWTWVGSLTSNNAALSTLANGTELIPAFEADYDQKTSSSTTTSATYVNVPGIVWSLVPTGAGSVIVTCSVWAEQDNPAVGEGFIRMKQTAGDGTLITISQTEGITGRQAIPVIGIISDYTAGTTLTATLQYKTNGSGTIRVRQSHGVIYEVPKPQ